MAFYPGSSIGNFEPGQVMELLGWIGHMVGVGGRLLVGVDLKKDEATLNAAYNDPEGVTAAFNRNLLVRMQRELGADLVLSAFDHHAFYNVARGRIEMHLVANRPTRIVIDDASFAFDSGEGIHTECSYKYSVDEFVALAALSGFQSERVWCDERQRFSVHCLRAGARN